jgi:tetratricopeptide (TPR) repeat protein
MSKKAFLTGKSTQGLKFSEKDISLMKECLVKVDYEIFIPQQDKPSIIESFDEFIDDINYVDTILFYYSGHGHLEDGDLYLVFGDEIEKNKNKIEIEYFIKRIDKSLSSNKLIILDCCNALNIESTWKPSQIGRHKILTASGQIEPAKELENFGSSYFTYIFNETLKTPQETINQDGEILIHEFYKCLKRKAIEYNKNSNIRVPIPNLIGNHQSNFALAHFDKHCLSNQDVNTQNLCVNNQVFTNLPDPENDLFVGRDFELDKLFEYLSPNFTRKSILIYGFGGVGKTALAIEAAKQCWESKSNHALEDIPKFDSIIYITFKEFYFRPDGIHRLPNGQSSLQDIFRVIIDIYDISIINELSEKDKTEKIYQLLKKQRNLLIVDNIDALDDVEQRKVISFIDYVPSPTKVIITSRCQISSSVSVKINSLNENDSIKLILNQFEQKQLNLISPDQIAYRLYKKFQGIPIALICAVGQLSLNFTIESVLDTHNSNPNSTPEELAFFCFENSLKPLKGKPSHKLLMAMVIFSNSSCRKAIIHVSAIGSNAHAIDNSFTMLNQLSLVTTDNNRYDLVSILREYVSSDLDNFEPFEIKARIRWVQWYIKYVKTHGGYDLKNWRYNYNKLEIEWDNILSVLTWCRLNNRYDDIKKIWLSIDCYVDLVGHWNMRIDWWIYIKENAYALRDKKMYVRSLVDLGWTYTLLGSDHSQFAKKEYLEALKNIHDATPETSITLYKNIAVLRITQKRYRCALRWLNKSNLLLTKHASSLSVQNHLDQRFHIINQYYIAETYYKLGHLSKSLSLFRKTNISSSKYGWTRINNYVNNYLGLIYTKIGSLNEARMCLEDGLIEARNSQESRRIALYQLSLALLEEKENNLEMVKKYSADALKVFRSSVMREEYDLTESLLQRIGFSIAK